MARDWEAQFRVWAKPPGKTEEQRCNNAITSIRNAIGKSDKLRNRKVSVFVQGSYRNNTNVRKDSDVDVGVCCGNTYLNDYPEEMTCKDFKFSSADYRYSQFKDEVEEALITHFGHGAVTRGNKAFDIHETSYHVDADVAPFFVHRRYRNIGSYHEGVAMIPDNSVNKIKNWPEQHYSNGCRKNMDTGRRYKSIVRILKALSNEMVEKGISDAGIPGFLIECMVWNVPDTNFQNRSFAEDVKAALGHIYHNTKNYDKCQKWVEVSGLKWLFRPPQKWTHEQGSAFAYAAWNYEGLSVEA